MKGYRHFCTNVILISSLLLWSANFAQAQQEEFCTVTNSDSFLIVNIVESLGSQTSQETQPKELPLSGVPERDIELTLVYPKDATQYFYLEGKSLRLRSPIDRDPEDLASLQLEVICTVLSTGKRKTIPLIVTISDINDNTPKFTNLPYVVPVPEDTKVGSVIFRDFATIDQDSNVNGQVEYFIGEDGGEFFEINLPHQGLLTLKKKLDYESQKTHFVNIIARDRAVNPENRFSSSVTLTVNVLDSDDQPPKFVNQEGYTAKVISGINSGPLQVSPEKIHAEDQDTLRSSVEYEFVGGTPTDFRNFFTINFQTGIVTQIAPVSRTSAKEYNISVKASEISRKRLFAETFLTVKIMAEDLSPPVLSVTAEIGYIDENSPVGTVVQDSSGANITFRITDADLPNAEDLPKYAYEITTTAFMIDDNGYLIVNQANLDRDPPNENRLSFQVFVRELGEDEPKSSRPVRMTVNLKDVNDNAPVLESVRDISVVAGTAKRNIATLSATDKDGDNLLTFQIVRVTNNGKRIFNLNSRSGKLDLIGAVRAGEHYALTVEVSDSGGKSSQGVIEVRVTPQPNLLGPVFSQFLYQAQINEDAAKFATVISTEAKDPEGDLVRYAIVGGNEENQFLIEESTGEIRVSTSLDRETRERYSLRISAEDNGGKSNTATVNIKVLDVNDQSPAFNEQPYSFRVDEGLIGEDVGQVQAEDQDLGDNAIVHYSIEEDQNLFKVDDLSGMIKTVTELDFEAKNVHYLVVKASDLVNEPATATVTILVQDVQDETPKFDQTRYEGKVLENLENQAILSVQATDLDNIQTITYEIVSGDQTLFSIDPESGELRTLKGLDFEQQKIHFLTVSTVEARQVQGQPSSSCQIEISVEDQNDHAPIFISPRQVSVRNDAKVGSKVAIVKATDEDGTAPGNQVRYQFVQPSDYFAIDEESGEIELLSDLTKEVYGQYTLEIKAIDLGLPMLETKSFLVIRVDQVVTMAPELGIGFASLKYEANIDENLAENTVVQVLDLDQVPIPGLDIQCLIFRVKDQRGAIVKDVLKGVYNEQNHQCELQIQGKMIDKEKTDSLEVMVKLKTQSAFVNPARMMSTVFLNIQDVNDNKPTFVFNERQQNQNDDQNYLVTISKTTSPNTGIVQIKAIDQDSGDFGTVAYSLDDDQSGLFAIDAQTGIVRTTGNLASISNLKLPFRLKVTAFDNPNGVEYEQNSRSTSLFVNLISVENSIVLVIDDVPVQEMELKRGKLQTILQEQTNLVVSIDHLVPRLVRYRNDTCCKLDQQGTDVYFHVLDPKSGKVLTYNDDLVQSKITDKRASSNLKYTVSSLLEVQASEVHEPYLDAPGGLPGSKGIIDTPVRAGGVRSNFDGLPAALIAIGCLVFAFAFAAILYLCIMRRKQVEEVEKQPKTIVIPRYQPVFVEPNLKEYETQVLQMSVTMDDNSEQTRHLDQMVRNLRYQPSFSMDNISYITKDKTGDSLSTTKISGDFESSKDTSHYSTLEGDLDDSFFSRENDVNPNYLSASRTNENVIFGNGSTPEFVSSTPRRKKSSSKSPIDSTTQL